MSTIGTTGSADLKMDFLNLMVAQMQNQNPLDPMDNTQMTTQLAQISSLEQLEGLNGTFAKVLAAQQLSQAAGLIGKQVTFLNDSQPVQARVDSVQVQGGQVSVRAGQYTVGLDSILSVSN